MDGIESFGVCYSFQFVLLVDNIWHVVDSIHISQYIPQAIIVHATSTSGFVTFHGNNEIFKFVLKWLPSIIFIFFLEIVKVHIAIEPRHLARDPSK